MRLADYINRFSALLAANLRRLAELLSPKPTAEDGFLKKENGLSPPAAWLEKIKNVSPAEWLEFTGETVDAQALFLPKTPASEKTSQTNEAAIAESKPQKTLEAATEFVVKTASQPKDKSRFLSFRRADQKPLPPAAQPAKHAPQIFAEPSFETKKSPATKESLAAAKSKFRLLPSTPILDQKPQSNAAQIKFAPRESTAKNEIFVRKQTKSCAEPTKKTALKSRGERKTKNSVVLQPILKKRVFSRAAASRVLSKAKTRTLEKESCFEKSNRAKRDFSNTELTSELPYSPPKATLYFPSRTKNASRAPDNAFLTNNEQEFAGENVAQTRASDQSFNFSQPPWADLPGENLPDAFEEIEKSRLQIEHLQMLEREQGGEKRNKEF